MSTKPTAHPASVPTLVAGVRRGSVLRSDAVADVCDGWEVGSGRSVRVRVARRSGALARDAEALVGRDGVRGDADVLIAPFDPPWDAARCVAGALERMRWRLERNLGWSAPTEDEVGAAGPVLLDCAEGMPVGATLAAVARAVGAGGCVGDLLLSWRECAPEDVEGADALVRRALADDLASQHQGLLIRRLAVEQADRRHRLDAALRRLAASVPPPAAPCGGADLADAPAARAWLRVHGRTPDAAGHARWVRAGLAVRTLRLLLRAAA